MSNNRISAYRHQFGMNQRELGELLGVGQTTVSAWEKGKNEPDHETLHKMAQLFRCSIGYLMGYEHNEVTRGLTREQMEEYAAEDEQKKAIEEYERELEYQQGGLTPDEIEELIAEQERADYQAWLKEHPDVYFEAYRTNQICENLSAKQRKEMLSIIESFERALKQ